MAIALSDVNGIGPATIKILQGHGFKSAEDLAAADIEQLVAVPGFSQIRASAVIASAVSLFIDDDHGQITQEASTEAISEPKKDKKTKKVKKDKKSDSKKKDAKSKKNKKAKKSDKDKKTKKAKKK